MKKKEPIIIIIMFLIIIALIITIIFLKKNDEDDSEVNKELIKDYEKLSDDEQKTLNKEINDLFKSALELNELYTSKYLDEEVSFANEYGYNCYMYNSEDSTEQIQKIRDTYYNSKHNLMLFNFSTIDGEDGKQELLYLCKPDCTPEKMQVSDFEILIYQDDQITTVMDGTTYKFKYEDGKLKLDSEFYKCNLDEILKKHGEEDKAN